MPDEKQMVRNRATSGGQRISGLADSVAVIYSAICSRSRGGSENDGSE